MQIRVRYAPSPTGLQHIGGLRTALFNYLFARNQGGKFILRIEDTDQGRLDPSALDDCEESLRWCGIHCDEGPGIGGDYGPYRQSERLDFYHEAAEQLVKKGLADRVKESHEGKNTEVIRLRTPQEGKIAVDDYLLGKIVYEFKEVPQNTVLIKSDGYPTYHLANVVDDHYMQISHVLRSQEWLPSLPLHQYLYRCFEWSTPQFCHLPLVLGADGKKLSKRHGATSVRSFREAGYLSDALVNYIALLGWAYDDRRQLFTQEVLEKEFSLQKLQKSPAVFDYVRLNWFNKQYIQNLTDEKLFDLLTPWLENADFFLNENDREKSRLAMPVIKPRLTTLSEAITFMRCLLFRPLKLPLQEEPRGKEILEAVRKAFSQEWGEPSQLVDILRRVARNLEVSVKRCFLMVQIGITGSKISLPVAEVIGIVGREESLARLAEYQRIREEK